MVVAAIVLRSRGACLDIVVVLRILSYDIVIFAKNAVDFVPDMPIIRLSHLRIVQLLLKSQLKGLLKIGVDLALRVTCRGRGKLPVQADDCFLNELEKLKVPLILLAVLRLPIGLSQNVVEALYQIVWVDLGAEAVELPLGAPGLNRLPNNIEARRGTEDRLLATFVDVAAKTNNLYFLLRL